MAEGDRYDYSSYGGYRGQYRGSRGNYRANEARGSKYSLSNYYRNDDYRSRDYYGQLPVGSVHQQSHTSSPHYQSYKSYSSQQQYTPANKWSKGSYKTGSSSSHGDKSESDTDKIDKDKAKAVEKEVGSTLDSSRIWAKLLKVGAGSKEGREYNYQQEGFLNKFKNDLNELDRLDEKLQKAYLERMANEISYENLSRVEKNCRLISQVSTDSLERLVNNEGEFNEL